VNKKKIITRIAILIAWIMVISGITTLLVAANQKHAEKVCREVVVGITGSAEKFFVEESEIVRQLEKYAGKLVNRPISQFSTDELEVLLEKDSWIKDAELYFDSRDVLHVSVVEREPVARIFTVYGSSFYIDSSGHMMPLNKIAARVPVITGFPASSPLRAKDSALLQDVKYLAAFIYQHPFWNAQTGQIDIVQDRKFEIIPLVGDHVIRLGTIDNLEEKLDKMMVFYKRVLSRTGFSKYGVIDVQFKGQVVGIQRGSLSKVDSVQLQKNISVLLEKSNIQNLTNEMLPEAGATSDTIRTGNLKVPVKNDPVPPVKPEPARSIAVKVPSNPTRSNEKPANAPKAVMPARKG
jgi:cell division protein FtsQ